MFFSTLMIKSLFYFNLIFLDERKERRETKKGMKIVDPDYKLEIEIQICGAYRDEHGQTMDNEMRTSLGRKMMRQQHHYSVSSSSIK